MKRFQPQPVVALIVGKSFDKIGEGAVETVVVHGRPALDNEIAFFNDKWDGQNLLLAYFASARIF